MVHKSISKVDNGNYHPISIHPSIFKVYDKAMHNMIVTYIDSNNLIHREQHGFRKGKLTTSVLVKCLESVIDLKFRPLEMK